MTFAISDLRQRPEFFDAVADRIWQAWWQHRVSREKFVERVRENLVGPGMPLALIAHDGGGFLGTASLIASDLDERPHYTPWVAAVWVEPDARGQGIGRALVERAADEGFALGHARIYLCAPPARRSYYVELGWTPIEDGVGPRDLTVFVRNQPTLDANPAP